MKQWILPAITICILGGFLWREHRVSQLSVPLIMVEENVVLLRAGEDLVFGMGRIDSSRAKALSRGMMSFFSSGKIQNVWDIEVGNSLTGENFQVQRVSENMVRSISEEQVIWWIGDDFSGDEKEAVVQSGIDFGSAWWVMTKNRLPEFLPLPEQGILFAGDRAPSQKTLDFAQEKEIPMISVKETNGFMLSYIFDSWELKTRD